ncbi:MAG TPA: PilZ domain-containing protein [Smithella sp.]|nr:PilZ domain-containing protein [Smithella sp.]
MDEKESVKQLKNGKQKKARPSKKAERDPERLREENDIIITILSEIDKLPEEKIIYNHSKDISTSGTRIQGNVLLPVDTYLKIDLTLKNSKEKITVFGKVLWSKAVSEGKSYEAGVEFVDTPDESIKILGDYIMSIKDYTNLNPVGVPYWIFAKFNKPESK